MGRPRLDLQRRKIPRPSRTLHVMGVAEAGRESCAGLGVGGEAPKRSWLGRANGHGFRSFDRFRWLVDGRESITTSDESFSGFGSEINLDIDGAYPHNPMLLGWCGIFRDSLATQPSIGPVSSIDHNYLTVLNGGDACARFFGRVGKLWPTLIAQARGALWQLEVTGYRTRGGSRRMLL